MTKSTLFATLALIAAPLGLLWPCLFGDRTFVPFDLAQWAPVATTLDAEELAEITAQQNTDVPETVFTFLPEQRFVRQEIAAGRLPEWNPYARGGAPLLATAVVGLLYPPNWPGLVLGDPADALAWGAWFAMAVAGVLAFGFLRALGLTVAAALLGGLAFALGGTMYANAHFYQRLGALIWLPGMLWAVQRLATGTGGSRLPAAIGLAVTTALTWLAGFPSYAAAATLVVLLWAAAHVLGALRARAWRAARSLGAMVMAPLLLGTALAAVQLVPMFAFFPESNRRPDPGPEQIASQGYDPAGFLGYLLPDPYGHPTTTRQFEYWQSPLLLTLYSRARWDTGEPFVPPNYHYVEYTVFPGTLVLLLAIGGLLRRRPFRGMLAAALAVLLSLAVAPWWTGPLYALPGIESVPPLRFAGPAALLVAALAALGLQRLGEGSRRTIWILAGASGALALLAWWAGSWVGGHGPAELLDRIDESVHAHYARANPDLTLETVRSLIGPAMAPARIHLLANLRYGAVAFGLAALWLGLLPWARRRGLWPWWQAIAIAGTALQLLALAHGVSGGRVLRHRIDSDVHAFLREQRDRCADQGGFTVARAEPGPQTDLPLALPPCTLVPERIRDLNVYTFVDGRSHRPFAELYGKDQLFRFFWIKTLPDDERLSHPYLDLLGVRFLLSEHALENAGRRVGPTVEGPRRSFFVYERPSALPRAFTVPTVRVLPDDDAVIAAMVAPDFAPRAAALVTPQERSKLGAALPSAADTAGRAVRFVTDTPTEIVLEVGDGDPGYLLLSDTYLSGWSATVGGAAAPILRADLCLRAVPLPAGPTEVRFRYSTPGLAAGAGITGLALLVLAGLAIAWARARRKLR